MNDERISGADAAAVETARSAEPHVTGKHTPGPWSAFYKHKYDEWHVSMPCENSEMRVALSPDGIPGHTNEERGANAHLIAAAPLMLAALKVIEANCPCGARPESPATHPHVSGCPVGYAIAKAEGRH